MVSRKIGQHSKLELNSEYFMKIQMKLFLILGFNIFSRDHLIQKPFRTFLNTVPLMLFLIPMFTAAIVNSNDVDIVSDVLCATTTGCLAIIKFLIFMKNRKVFVDLIARIRNLLAQGENIFF